MTAASMARTAGPAAPEGERLEPEVRVVAGENCQRTLEVQLPQTYIGAAHATVLKRYMSRIKLRGFRKGRAPAQVILRHYGRDIMRDAIELACETACRQAIDSEGLKPLTDVVMGDHERADDGSLSFTATFEVVPEIQLNRLGGFRIERPPVAAPAERVVDGFLDEMRQARAVWRTEDEGRPEAGDEVTVSLEQVDGDESRSYDLVLGRGQALPDVEEAILALAPGESGEFDVAFPDDHPDEKRAGTRHRMRIALESRRVPVVPELDDAFARSVGDFGDLDALRERVATDMKTEARVRAESEVDRALVQAVVDANPFDVPASMMEGYLDRLLQSLGDLPEEESEKVREQARPTAEFAVKRDLAIMAIADEHGLNASAGDVSERVARLAELAGVSPSAMRSRLRRERRLEMIERELTEARVCAFLKERSEVT